MRPETFDPTAGERARAIVEHREQPGLITDPMAGERARAIHELGELPPVTDPTDPRVGPARARNTRPRR